jgi:hypothetical protein
MWLKGKTTAGYGHLWRDGKVEYAHRIAWELVNGPIPDGAEICHNCPDGDQPGCCNPAHLFPGTHYENMMDMHDKKRHAHGDGFRNAKLTSAEVIEIRARYALGGVMQKDLAAEFGVAKSTIGRIVRGVDWRHLEGPITK